MKDWGAAPPSGKQPRNWEVPCFCNVLIGLTQINNIFLSKSDMHILQLQRHQVVFFMKKI